MGSWIRRQGPAFAVACLALLVALGGSVYAASRIDGHAVRRGSLPGNRLERASVPGNRLQPGTLRGGRIAPGSLTGREVDASTLGRVPEAEHAESAGSARTASTALAADSAAEAARLNGHSAGCAPQQRLFAGACWELGRSAAATAPEAAAACATRGGELPAALALAAFGGQPGVELAFEGEWSGELAIYSGPNSYAAATVRTDGEIVSAPSNAPRPFRCVIPLVS
ncbi:MAG TPA: hypothetical protein VGG40_13620 [Solirubrobacterales bacterium]|jgi:hypothetical protein